MLRSGEPVARQWQTLNSLDASGASTDQRAQMVQAFPFGGSNGRMRKQQGRDPLFPFRIYQTPSWYLAAPDPSTDWLNFVVRGGLYNGTAATLTDGESFPYDETFPVTSGLGTGVITVPSGVSQFWFWCTTAGAIGSGTALPGLGETQIGWVDTTDTTNCIPHIRQIQFGDIQATPNIGINFRGYWVSTTTYNLNDLVVVQSGVSAGAWISLIASNTNNPATGNGWMQIAPGNQVGSWS